MTTIRKRSLDSSRSPETRLKNDRTPFREVIERADSKGFFNRRADELFDKKVYKFSESRDFSQCLVRHVFKSSTSTVPVIRFVKLQAEIAVAVKRSLGDVTFRQYLPRKKSYHRRRWLAALPYLPSCLNFKKKKRRKKIILLNNIPSPHLAPSEAQAEIPTSEKLKSTELKPLKVFKQVNCHFTAALDFRYYRLQKQSKLHNSHISCKIPQ